MKRSAALTPLSHDHHQGLFVALKLKRDADAAAAEAFTEFLDGEGHAHFDVEEEVLLPRWLEADPTADDQAARRVLDDHREILSIRERIRESTLTPDELRSLGTRLEEHIRFEERELFPRIEAGLSEADLASLGAEIASANADES